MGVILALWGLPGWRSMKKNLLLFTVCYVAALSLIALASVGIHWAERETIARQEHNAEIINIAGRQRMLSQRIAGLYARAHIPQQADSVKAEVSQRLTEAMELMALSHERLAYTDLVLSAKAPLRSEIDKLYSGEIDLNRRIPDFLSLVQSTERAGFEKVSAVSEEADRVLQDLNQAVTVYEQNARIEIRDIENLTQAGVLLILFLLLAEAFLIFRPLGNRLHSAEQHLKTIASTDPLTGCHNRRGLMTAAQSLLAYFSRHRKEVAAIVFDIDHFKKVNDTYGHGAGDEVIKFVVDRALSRIRASDVMGRIGGEEFVIFCPDTNCDQAAVVAEKIRKVVEGTPYKDGPLDIRVTCSFGIFAMLPGKNPCPTHYIDRADEGLYAAKRDGRNRVRINRLPAETVPQITKSAAA